MAQDIYYRVCESNTYQFIIFNCLLVSNVWASSAKFVEQYVCKILLKFLHNKQLSFGIKEFEFKIVWNFADVLFRKFCWRTSDIRHK